MSGFSYAGVNEQVFGPCASSVLPATQNGPLVVLAKTNSDQREGAASPVPGTRALAKGPSNFAEAAWQILPDVFLTMLNVWAVLFMGAGALRLLREAWHFDAIAGATTAARLKNRTLPQKARWKWSRGSREDRGSDAWYSDRVIHVNPDLVRNKSSLQGALRHEWVHRVIDKVVPFSLSSALYENFHLWRLFEESAAYAFEQRSLVAGLRSGLEHADVDPAMLRAELLFWSMELLALEHQLEPELMSALGISP
jgi:hypothetical protein